MPDFFYNIITVIGEFVGNMRNGHGVQKYADGSLYDGGTCVCMCTCVCVCVCIYVCV